jgi:protein-tyrosine phosphatase
MRRVFNYPLWIGHALDIRGLEAVHAAGIEAVVDLAINEPVPLLTRELIYCRFPIVDGSGNRVELLRLAVYTAADLLRAGVPTLLACSAGMSRSPAIAAAAIAKMSGRPPTECLAEVFDGAPRDLSPGLWQDLLNLLTDG